MKKLFWILLLLCMTSWFVIQASAASVATTSKVTDKKNTPSISAESRGLTGVSASNVLLLSSDEKRMRELKADGVISPGEKDEYLDLLKKLNQPTAGQEYPVILEDVSETEPNDQCSDANPISNGDRVICAHLTPPDDTLDYYTFTLDDTYSAWAVTCSTYFTSNCQPSAYDTKMYLYNADCSELLAYNDNAGPGQAYSKITVLNLAPGIYNIAVAPYASWVSGGYNLELSCGMSCAATCPLGGVQEVEDNGGCNSETPVFDAISPGETVCGTGFFDSYTRDTDWFLFNLTQDQVVTLRASAEFDFFFGIITPYSEDPCDFSGNVDYPYRADHCDTAVVSRMLMGPGQYIAFMAPQFTDIFADGNYWMTLTYEAPPPPPDNDFCEFAAPIGEVTGLQFSTLTAMYDGLGACMTSPNIWYLYTSTITGLVEANTVGSSFDTKLAVYDGSECGTAAMLGCDDNSYGLQSKVLFYATAGNQYLIEVGGANDYTGTGVLNVGAGPTPPPNDLCQNVTPASLTSGSPLTFNGTVVNATNIDDCPSFPVYGNVWEAFTTTECMDITIDFCGTPGPFGIIWLNLAIGCPCADISADGSYDNTSCGDGNLTVRWIAVPPGTYYYPILYSPELGNNGPYTVHVTGVPCPPVPTNDNCADASPIGNVTDLSFNTRSATHDGSGSYTSPSAPNIWYVYTAACSGTAKVDLCGSSFDTKLAVYNGSTCDPLPSLIQGNDDFCGDQSSVSFRSVAGNQYLIEVGASTDGSGAGDISVDCVAPIFGVSPSTVSGQVPSGGSTAETLTVANTGMGALNYTVSVREDPSALRLGPRISPDLVTPSKNVADDPSRAILAQQIARDQIPPARGRRNNVITSGGHQSHERPLTSFLVESFETAVPPDGWTLVQNNPSASWYQGDFEPYDGRFYALCYPDFNLEQQDEWLISPTIDLSTASSEIRVEFNWLMSYYYSVSPLDNYDLQLWISTDGGETFSDQLWSEQTVGQFDDYIWYRASISLSTYIGQSNVKLGWRYYGLDGDEADLDLCVVTDDPPPIGRCCYGPDPTDPQCADITQRACSDLGGLWDEYSSCDYGPCPIPQTGDNCLAPLPVNVPADLPFADINQTTMGRGDEHNTMTSCGFYQDEDMVYRLDVAATSDLRFTFDPHGTPFTSMALYDACDGGNCLNMSSSIAPNLHSFNAQALGPGTYYLWVDSHNFDGGINSFNLTITQTNIPHVDCPPDAAHELEECFGSTNDGCDIEPPSYEDIAPNSTVCGTCYSNLWSRDTDWYLLTVTEPTLLTYSAAAEFPVQIMVMSSDCANPEILAVTETLPESLAVISIPLRTAGTYTLFISPSDWLDMPCDGNGVYPNDYYITATCQPLWLTTDVVADTIPEGQDGRVIVTMDASILASGAHTGDIIFNTNEFGSTTREIPVYFRVGAGCVYVVGDDNNSGTWTGQDVTYGVRFFKGGNPPQYRCECPSGSGHEWYVAGDVNGSCSFTGQDVTRMVLHFKSGVVGIPCPDCPPAGNILIKDDVNPILKPSNGLSTGSAK